MNKLKKIASIVTHGKTSKKTISSKHVIDTTAEKLNSRIVQNFRLVWLDSSIDEINNNDTINTITKLQQTVNTVEKFTDVDQCIDFMTDIEDEKIFLIISGTLGQLIIPLIHDIIQINYIYIFCQYKEKHELWAKEWMKIKGVYTCITDICEALKQAAQESDHNLISMSLIRSNSENSNKNIDSLDQSFMNTQLLKEILCTIDFQQEHIDEFLFYCREQFIDNINELENIDKLEQEYHCHEPIWWYTYNCFLYSMLNRALRLMEIDLIITMGFFIRDLHNHIAVLHDEQYSGQKNSDSFTVYRGQGLSQIDFNRLENTRGGLLSFNNFLSTSKNFDVSLEFVQRTMSTSNLVGVLFIMKIDPSLSATPFADVGDVGYYGAEKEILFSMHSVFRIGQMEQIDKNDRLWQVDLILTSDDDPQLNALTKSMQKETENWTGWDRLGMLLIKLGQSDKAEGLYEMMLEETNDEGKKAHLYHMLGMTKEQQGQYGKAVKFYENSIKIKKKILPSTHQDLIASYNNIGLMNNKRGKYSKALSYYEKVVKVNEKTLPSNHPNLGASYNNIGLVYNNLGEYSKALSYYDKALEISQKILPGNHPHLATCYNNIGSVFKQMQEYTKALEYYEKSLEVRQKILPIDHPDLAESYNNIGKVYNNIGDYPKALSYYNKSLEIGHKVFPENHPSLLCSCSNMGLVYENIGDYSNALLFFTRTMDIQKHSLPPRHPKLKTTRMNIERVQKKLHK